MQFYINDQQVTRQEFKTVLYSTVFDLGREYIHDVCRRLRVGYVHINTWVERNDEIGDICHVVEFHVEA